ncbi:hypothetical protein HOLleu_04611 [Holothuria leucospilota]|uniref:Uncharacterized protein n=1 Tax=Holothuria leucospilota TaxID=206669 RepID=A0A9Q1HLY9_HOLLE|nr:hypothetical protein HOLleu_04611 [Holothuria leucospilota]
MLSVLKTFWSLVGENCIMPKKKRLKSYETIRKYGRDRARKSRKNRQLKRANREGQKTDNVIQTEEKVVGLDEHDSNEDDENGSGGHDDKSSKTEYTKKPEPEEDARTSSKTNYPKKPAPEEGMMLTLSWNIPEDVLRRANANELQEEDQSVMKISVDLPYEREGIYDSVEEKYSDVLRRDNLPYTTDDLGDSVEEKYSDVLKRNNTLTASTDVEGSLDVTSFAGSNTQHKSGKRHNWKVMENYRKRCNSKDTMKSASFVVSLLHDDVWEPNQTPPKKAPLLAQNYTHGHYASQPGKEKPESERPTKALSKQTGAQKAAIGQIDSNTTADDCEETRAAVAKNTIALIDQIWHCFNYDVMTE